MSSAASKTGMAAAGEGRSAHASICITAVIAAEMARHSSLTGYLTDSDSSTIDDDDNGSPPTPSRSAVAKATAHAYARMVVEFRVCLYMHAQTYARVFAPLRVRVRASARMNANRRSCN